MALRQYEVLVMMCLDSCPFQDQLVWKVCYRSVKAALWGRCPCPVGYSTAPDVHYLL